MENYLDQKFDQAALKHLKFQVLRKSSMILIRIILILKKMESKIFGTRITTLLESLDYTSKPFRLKCNS